MIKLGVFRFYKYLYTEYICLVSKGMAAWTFLYARKERKVPNVAWICHWWWCWMRTKPSAQNVKHKPPFYDQTGKVIQLCVRAFHHPLFTQPRFWLFWGPWESKERNENNQIARVSFAESVGPINNKHKIVDHLCDLCIICPPDMDLSSELEKSVFWMSRYEC